MTPSLQQHYTAFITTASHSAPVPHFGTQFLAGSADLERSLCIEAAGSRVPSTSLYRDHAAFTPDAAPTVNRLSSELVPGQQVDPGFDTILTLSMLHQRFTFVRLLDTYLTRLFAPFP
jgi:hypothetical protein